MHLVMLLIAAALLPPPAADGVHLQVQAGLGGVARARRWMPVRVIVDNTGADVTGELSIAWGDARVHRLIALASPSRTVIDSYLRTVDVRDHVSVEVIAGGTVVAASDARVRVAGDDEPVRVCIASGGIASDGDGDVGC